MLLIFSYLGALRLRAGGTESIWSVLVMGDDERTRRRDG